MTYWAERFEAAVVFPKCPDARTASEAICAGLAAVGSAEALSYQTPASAPPGGEPTCEADAAHDVAPVGTPAPSQYCVITPDHSSFPVPRPLNICWSLPAPPTVSVEKARLPLPSVLEVPHWLPQNTRYTLGLPLVTPMPSTPPPYDSVWGPVAARLACCQAFIFEFVSCVGTAPCR